MRTDKPPLKQRALQKLLLRRFGMAAGTYLLGLVLLWLALLSGFYRAAPTTAAASTTLVVACQLAFLWLFASGRNLRYADPSLTEPQVLVAIAWLTYFLYHVDSLRGTFMVFYVLALLFGVFQLPPRVFARCAALAFIAFSGIYLVEALQQRLELPGRAALQVLVMFIVMVWLSLFASYIQAMRQRMRQRRYALQAHQDTLRGMMRQLEDLVATDELTGLFNRRHFMRLASRALEDLLPNRQHGLALIDLDHFKRINDRHGHAAGDRVLQTFAAVARSCLRDGDVLARYGGEEFVLLLPHADAEQLESCCERLRLAFEQAEPVGVTVDTLSLSVGMTLLGRRGNCLVHCLQGEVEDTLPEALDPVRREAGWRLACQCRVLGDLVLQPFDPERDGLPARVVACHWLGDVLRLRLEPERPLRYRAGQHLLLWSDDGVARPYSLASLPHEDPWLEFHIDCSAPGAFCDRARRLAPGALLRLGELRGGALRYEPDWQERPLLLMAAGTGLAPLWGILREALRAEHQAPIQLLHLARDHYLASELAELAGRHPQLRVNLVSAAQLPSALADLRLVPRRSMALLCGQPASVERFARHLYLAGVPRSQTLADLFLPHA